jgi:hypothetical protein
MNIKTLFSVGAVIVGLSGVLAAPASANYIFSGSGTSGNFVGQAAEPWILNFVTPFDNWGSPGVGAGITPYLQADSAFGLDLTFSGVGPIDAASIALGNASACVGSSGGGTTFCNAPFGANGFWQAFLTGANSISFRAQNVGQILDQGENFFVNVFFAANRVGAQDISFKGEWITEFAPNPTPVPGILPLLATGLGLLQLSLWRKKRSRAIAA